MKWTDVCNQWLKRKNAARYLDVCPATLDKLVQKGLLPPPSRIPSRPGGRLISRWNDHDLDAAMAGFRAGTPKPSAAGSPSTSNDIDDDGLEGWDDVT